MCTADLANTAAAKHCTTHAFFGYVVLRLSPLVIPAMDALKAACTHLGEAVSLWSVARTGVTKI